MTDSRTFRGLFLGSLNTAIVGMVALTGWLVVWPELRSYWTIRSLIAQLDDEAADRFEAREALLKIGSDAVPALIRSLSDQKKDPLGRIWAAYVLGDMGSQASAAVPALIQALEDPSNQVRAVSAETLARIGPGDD